MVAVVGSSVVTSGVERSLKPYGVKPTNTVFRRLGVLVKKNGPQGRQFLPGGRARSKQRLGAYPGADQLAIGSERILSAGFESAAHESYLTGMKMTVDGVPRRRDSRRRCFGNGPLIPRAVIEAAAGGNEELMNKYLGEKTKGPRGGPPPGGGAPFLTNDEIGRIASAHSGFGIVPAVCGLVSGNRACLLVLTALSIICCA